MGRKLQIAAVVAVVVLIVCAVGAYAWDNSQKDTIARGVKIGAVAVGDLTRDQAKGELRSDLVEPLDKSVVVTHEDVKYVLKPDKLGLAADIDGMVDKAIEASRDAALPARLWRYASGGEVNRTITPRISYSEEALDEFIAKVEADVNREPVDASVEPSPTSLNVVAGQTGQTLETAELREQLEAAIQSPHGRTVEAEVDEIQPEVTKAEVASQYPTYLTLDRSSFQLRFWRDLELQKTYTVAVGAAGFDTPVGVYNIQNKQVDPVWNVPNSDWAGDLAGTTVPGGVAENPLKARWMGIFDGAGIHGTDDVGSLGSAASHGCVRMAVPDVIELYDQVDVGTPIYIG